MIPASNATLTAITAAGTSDDYDHAGTAGTVRWTSTLPVYVSERVIEDLTADRVDELIETRMEIPHTIGRLVMRGDTITYTKDSESLTRVAGTVWQNALVGRTRVLLETA